MNFISLRKQYVDRQTTGLRKYMKYTADYAGLRMEEDIRSPRKKAQSLISDTLKREPSESVGA